MRHAAIVLFMVSVTVPVFGDQSAVQSAKDPQPTTRFGALRSTQPKDPCGNLFKTQDDLKQALPQMQASMAKTKVVCGMTIITPDPAIDPKIGITPEKDDNVEYKIRAIEPPICNPAK